MQIRNRLGCLRDDKLKRKVCGEKIRPFGSSIVRTGNPGINRNRHDKENRVWIGEDCRAMQQRWFLGCGNEHEEDALAKIHEERVVIGYLFVNASIFFNQYDLFFPIYIGVSHSLD